METEMAHHTPHKTNNEELSPQTITDEQFKSLKATVERGNYTAGPGAVNCLAELRAGLRKIHAN